MIDKNAPWRLVANLNSANMQKYMARYNRTLEQVFDKCYIKTYKYDIDNIKVYLKQMYASYTSASPIQIREVESYYDKQSGACVPRRIAVERQKVNLEDFAASYDELFWLKLYYRIRLKEAQITPTSFVPLLCH